MSAAPAVVVPGVSPGTVVGQHADQFGEDHLDRRTAARPVRVEGLIRLFDSGGLPLTRGMPRTVPSSSRHRR